MAITQGRLRLGPGLRNGGVQGLLLRALQFDKRLELVSLSPGDYIHQAWSLEHTPAPTMDVDDQTEDNSGPGVSLFLLGVTVSRERVHFLRSGLHPQP